MEAPSDMRLLPGPVLSLVLGPDAATVPPAASAPANRARRCGFLGTTHERVTLNPRSCENVMRNALELLTGKPFVKIRPPWLRNPKTGRNLEIDAWNEELQLACEFQGYQHVTFPNCFHKSYDDFELQVQRDKFKAEKLRSMGIRLLEVPHTVPASGIPSFLAECLSRWNLLWPRDADLELSVITEVSVELTKCRSNGHGRIPRSFDMRGCAPMKLAPQCRESNWNVEWTPVYVPQLLHL